MAWPGGGGLAWATHGKSGRSKWFPGPRPTGGQPPVVLPGLGTLTAVLDWLEIVVARVWAEQPEFLAVLVTQGTQGWKHRRRHDEGFVAELGALTDSWSRCRRLPIRTLRSERQQAADMLGRVQRVPAVLLTAAASRVHGR